MSQFTNWLDTDEIGAAQSAIAVSLDLEADSDEMDAEYVMDLMSAWNALERIRCEITGDFPRSISGEPLPIAIVI